MGRESSFYAWSSTRGGFSFDQVPGPLPLNHREALGLISKCALLSVIVMRTGLLIVAAMLLAPVALADHGGHGGFHGSMHATPAVHGVAYAHSGHFYASPHGYYYHGYYGHPFYGPHYFAPRYFYGPHPYYVRPYYGYHYYYGPAWYGALAIGTFVATLPLYYDSFWWGGVRYYYYGDTYYRWNDGAGEYQVVAPPATGAAGSSSSGQSAAAGQLFVYPKQGQSEAQQQTDRYECHRWAADQTGYDPTQPNGQNLAQREDYARAETACLNGRGYSVK